jgi:hypothetical protein
MRIFAALALVAAALVPAAPAAAKPRVTWPAASTVQAGDSVAVTVRSPHRVRVALLRLSDAGTPIRTVAARRMRSGRFVAVVPAASVERRYLLAVDDRGRRLSRTITATPPPPAPPPSGPPGPPPCGEGAAKVETTIDRRSAARGETVTMTIRNTGGTCLGFGADFWFERWNGTGWEKAGTEDRAWPAWAASLSPGETYTVTTEVWRDIGTGRHRLAKYFSSPDGAIVVAAEEIDVTG